jgi:ribosomal protein S18 acetylase RimI-like enzyme
MMRRMLRMFGEAFGDMTSYTSKPPTDAYLRGLLASSTFIAVAALKGDDVVGGLAAYELHKFEQPRSEIYIYDLAVAERHRRRGVARTLIGELRTIASQRDVFVIFVQADPQDGPAIALYESLGTKHTAHHFDIAVPASIRHPRRTGRDR